MAKTTGGRSAANQLKVANAPKRGAKIAMLIAGCAVAALAVIYCAGCIFFYQRFWPNTIIGDANVSMMGASSARAALEQSSQDRTVNVSGQGVNFSLNGASAGLELNVDTAVSVALAKNESWQWPVQIFRSHDDSDVLSASFNTELLHSAIEGQLSAYNSIAADPTNAFLFFDEGSGAYRINPGSMGTKLDVDAVMDAIMEALAGKKKFAPLTSAHLVQQDVKSDDERLVNAMNAANSYLGCNLELTVASTPVAWLNPSTVKDWIVIDDDYNVWLDEGRLDAWVDALESQVDSGEQAGYVRTYTRPNDGKYITVTGGSYGWISNGAELAQLVRDAVGAKTVGTQEIPWKQTADHYNPGGADWGAKYVDVDLTEQMAYFFNEDGSLALTTPIISGSSAFGTSRLTPEGAYYITNKQREQVLKGLPDPNNDGKPLYETLVHYWMPFIGNMVGLHDAYWQSVWEDWVYTTADGSHGCVNLPPDVAVWCWDWISIGTPVITHY